MADRAILVPGWNPHLSHLFCTVKMVFIWIHWCISCQILSLRVICVFSDIVWQCSVCHVWRCVTPNICSNFNHFWKQKIQVIRSLFPNWCHVVPCSSIGAMLFLTPLYHPIHLNQIAAVWFPSYHLSWVASSDFYTIRIRSIRILPSHMYEIIQNTNDIQFGDIQLVFDHELQSHIKWNLPSFGTNEYMVLYLMI